MSTTVSHAARDGADAHFPGDGEMARRCRTLDWASTPLGPVARWPQSLRTTAATVLALGFPSVVLWGAELTQLYNDAYVPILGARHPRALGRPTAECWPEAWAFNAPIYARVRAGETVTLREQRYALARGGPGGALEDRFLTISYAPVRDEAGAVGGVLVTFVDVTAEVRGRAQLEEAFRLAPAFLAVLRGPDHVFELANDAYYRLVGRRDLVGRPALEALPELRGQGFDALLDRVRATGEPFVGRALPIALARTPGAPPEERFADFVYLPVAAPDGAPAGIVAHGTDVTEHVRARREVERLLAESEAARGALAQANAQLEEQQVELELTNQQLQENATELEAQAEELSRTHALLAERTREADAARRRLLDAFESISDPFFTVDRDWRLTYINPPTERVIGRPREGLIGKHLWEEFAEAVGTPFYDGAFRALREGRAVDVEAHYPPPLDFWAAMRMYPLADGLAVYYQDVTARKKAEAALAESERQLRAMVDAIPTIAWTARPDGAVDWFNARWYEYTGMAADRAAGWGWQEAHDPRALPDVVREWQAAMAAGAPVETTFPLRGADGAYRRFLTRVIPVRDAEGRVTRWFGTCTDVESERRAVEAADAAREAAEAANRAKSEFLGTMSHELRTPLNAIQGYTELLALGVRGPLTEAQRTDLDRVRRANRHLMGLITDILNFARLEAGQVELHVADVEVGPMVADLESLVAPQLAAKGLTFDHDACAPDTPGSPHVVRADPEKLRQVLLNLLTNAIKFTEPGGHVALLCTTDAAAGVVRLRVSDTGRGIPAAQVERIFEPFVQIDRHRTHASQQGVGLGLAISRDLARAMGGDLTVESEEGRGSAFTVTLRLA
ncbi:PAS domain-containing protein [Roseisolibacter sp. H3M3-2]|uniref:PAS domain-containing protein n=1 Tax=Roseisolibacter sp. H3M3-2 TaxID=3031323 RepID=UPI0023DBF425|nr:PAS domain-containing protein [Roseisolibacter sp. H3M3-2]MDF1502240.1 PAS domain-containing protein [Roseisolibacter sp. H3M3-2]